MPPHSSSLLLLLLCSLLSPPRVAATVCSGSTYSYGGASCASCAAGASFVSAAAGCAPAAVAALADTAFYLSGTSAEGIVAFPSISAPGGASFVADAFGAPNGALALASGSHLTAPGSTAPAALPAGGSVTFSAAAWVKCAGTTTWASVLEWGAAGDAGGLATAAAAALVVGSASPPPPNSGRVSTLAGSGHTAFTDGTGAAAAFSSPAAVAVVPTSGAIAVADYGNNAVRLVTGLGVVTTLAGSGVAGLADGRGASASFNGPGGIAFSSLSGVFVVADKLNNAIRTITTAGIVATLAGSGTAAFADGVGVAAGFSHPWGVTVIPESGIVVVADSLNHAIRLVTPLGVVTTLAGGGAPAFTDGLGTAASFNFPTGVAMSGSTVVVADSSNNAIRLVSTLGIVSTLAGGGGAGLIDGTGAAAAFSGPWGVVVLLSGVIAVADEGNNVIRLVTPVGAVTTFAGSSVAGNLADGVGTSANFQYPTGLATALDGTAIVVADWGNGAVRLVSGLAPPSLPACDSTWHHVAITYAPSAALTLSAYLDGVLVLAASMTVVLPAAAASTLRIGWSGDLATNSGSLFAGAASDLRIYGRALLAIEVAQLAHVCASGTYRYGGLGACAPCVADASFISSSSGCAPSATGAAGPADTAFYLSGASAEGGVGFPSISAPGGVSFISDVLTRPSGALALARGSHLTAPGTGAPLVLPAGGNVPFSASAWVKCAAPTTWAAVLEWGAAGDAGGLALVVGSLAPLPNSGAATTLAGSGVAGFADGAAAVASFSSPDAVDVFQATGEVVVADFANNLVRLISPLGVVTTLAGNGGVPALADGAGTAASFFNPVGVAIMQSSGVVVVADANNYCIRLISPLGLVSTLAGSGTLGFVASTTVYTRTTSSLPPPPPPPPSLPTPHPPPTPLTRHQLRPAFANASPHRTAPEPPPLSGALPPSQCFQAAAILPSLMSAITPCA